MIRFKLDAVAYRSSRSAEFEVSADTVLQPGYYRLFGPNGSGKSTLLKGLAGIVDPSRGRAILDREGRSLDANRYKRYMGYCPQQLAFHEGMTVRAYLNYVARMRLIPRGLIADRIDELLQTAGLSGEGDEKLERLSVGQKKRIMLLQALLADPDLLLLDEPFVHADIRERERMIRLLESDAGRRIVIAAEHPANAPHEETGSILMMADGNLRGPFNPSHLLTDLHGRLFSCRIPSSTWREGMDRIRWLGSVLSIRHGEPDTVFRVILNEGIAVEDLPCFAIAERPTMEDVYLRMRIPSAETIC